MNAVVSLALSKKYTEETAIDFGAVKGANCKIQTIAPIEGGNRITFQWKNDSDETRTSTLDVMNGSTGEDGISVVDISITDGHLICELSDGSTIDAGEFPTPTLSESLTVSNAVGGATVGKTYTVGTSLENIIRDMLIKEEAPVITFTITPSTTLYDEVTETVSAITMGVVVSKKTYDISNIKYYVDNTLVYTETTGVTSGGTFSYTHNFSSPININTTFKVVVTDSKNMTTTKSIQIKFIGKSYYGILDSTVTNPNESQIKAMNNTLKDSPNFIYNNISTEYGKVCYAYPKSLSALTYIKDEVNNLNYFNSFERTTVNVDGIDYYAYTQIDASSADNVQLTFKKQ